MEKSNACQDETIEFFLFADPLRNINNINALLASGQKDNLTKAHYMSEALRRNLEFGIYRVENSDTNPIFILQSLLSYSSH